MENAGYKTN